MRRRPASSRPTSFTPVDPDVPGGSPSRSALTRIAGDLRRFDTSRVDLVAGTRIGGAVAIALVLGLALHDTGAAASMGAGALLTGVTTAVGGPRPSVGLLGTVAVSMGLSTFVGSATGGLGWIHTVVLACWCLAGGLLMALGSPTSSVGTQAIAAMIVFGRFNEPVLGAAELAGYVIAGGTIQVLVVALTRLPTTLGDQRRAMAAACERLAALTRPRPTPRSGLPTAEALDAAEISITSLDSGGMEDLGALRALLDVARRARVELLVIDGLEHRLEREAPELSRRRAEDALLATFADVLTSVATGLSASPAEAAMASKDAEGLLERAASELAGLPTATTFKGGAPTATTADDGTIDHRPVLASLDDHLAAFAGQVRAISDLASRAYGPRRRSRRAVLSRSDSAPIRTRLRSDIEAVSAQLDLGSSIARHALRLMIVVTVAEILAHRSPLEHGYWVALTASVILRPDFSTTVGRGVARVVGTFFGVGLAGLFDLLIRPSDPAMVITATLFCVAACSTFQASYVAFSGFLTALVVVLVDFVTPSTLSLAGARLVDTAIGGGLALATYALWPSWSRSDAWQALARLASAQRGYLGAVLSSLVGDHPYEEAAVRAPSMAARRARSNAEATVARSLSEPAARRIHAATSQGVLGALRRVNLATHALRTDAAAGRPSTPVPALAPLRGALEEATAFLGAELSRRRRPTEHPLERPPNGEDGAPDAAMPPLRRLHDELAKALAGRPDVSMLLAETDELVDALDTAADLLDRHGPL